MSELTNAEIRDRLSLSESALRALPADAFAEKHRLRTECDELRATMRDRLESELDAAGDKWAERAARKGSHEEDPAAMKARIASPSDAAAGGGF